MFDLASPDNGVDVGRFMHHIAERNTRERRPLGFGHLVQHRGDLARLFIGRTQLTALAFGLLELLLSFEQPAAERAPRCDGHALVFAHGQDIAFEIALGGAPAALVDAELREGVVAGVLVCFGDDPSGGVADAEVEDFPRGDHVVEGLHEFGDGGGEVPPVDVEEVDVAGLEFPQAGLEGDLEAFGMVTLVVDLDTGVDAEAETGGELGGDDHFVAVLAPSHPFADPGFALFVLVVVGGVDEVAPIGVEVVEDGEGGFLAAFAHELFPGSAEVHGPQTDWGDADAGRWGEDAVVAEIAVGLGCGREDAGHGCKFEICITLVRRTR